MIACYDTADLAFQGGVPDTAQAILFYVDGIYANGAAARARFPLLFATGRAIGLTVRGREPAQGDDYEPGNWMGDAGSWCAQAIQAGVWRPIIYADSSDFTNLVWPSLERTFGRPLAPPGPGRRFRTILANPDGDPTIPADHDGKQWWWGSIQGGSRVDMDISSLRDDFFRTPAPGPPHPIRKDDMITASRLPDGRVELFVEKNDTGEVFHTWQRKTEDGGGWIGAEAGKRNAAWYSLGTPGKQ